MLKKLFITMGLVCSYLSLIIVLHRNGIEELLNIAICSGLLGIALKIWVQNTLYLACSLGVLALCFFMGKRICHAGNDADDVIAGCCFNSPDPVTEPAL